MWGGSRAGQALGGGNREYYCLWCCGHGITHVSAYIWSRVLVAAAHGKEDRTYLELGFADRHAPQPAAAAAAARQRAGRCGTGSDQCRPLAAAGRCCGVWFGI